MGAASFVTDRVTVAGGLSVMFADIVAGSTRVSDTGLVRDQRRDSRHGDE